MNQQQAKHHVLFFLSLLPLALLAGCASKESSAGHSEESAMVTEKIEHGVHKDVSITVRKLGHAKNPLQSKKLLRKYVPVEVEIQNNSSSSYVLTKENFELPIANVKRVTKKYSHSSLVSAFFLLFNGWYIYPLAAASLTILSVFGNAVGASYIGVSLSERNTWMMIGYMPITILVTSLTLHGVHIHRAHRTNKERRNLIRSIACDLTQPLLILKNSTIKKIFYIPKKAYKLDFNITLEKA